MKVVNVPDGIEKQLNIVENDSAKADRDIRAKYLITFKEGVANEVLWDILMQCNFMGQLDPNDKAAIGRYNAGLEIAEKAGVLKAIARHIFGITI
jgi:hypothetical protein